MISFKIALRFLRSGGTQTTLIVIGIAVAISIQLFVGLLIDSLQRTLVDRTIGNTPHITIVSSTGVAGIRDWESVLLRLEEIGSINDVAVSAGGNAFIVDDNNNLPVLVRGFNYESADTIYGIGDALYRGRRYEARQEILLGKELRLAC